MAWGVNGTVSAVLCCVVLLSMEVARALRSMILLTSYVLFFDCVPPHHQLRNCGGALSCVDLEAIANMLTPDALELEDGT